MFSPELTEGSAVQVLCGVSAGDKPLYFSWFKDGAPLPAELQVNRRYCIFFTTFPRRDYSRNDVSRQIEEKSLNEFSLLMFDELTARHSGDYTCRVTNRAAAVNYTAPLAVRGETGEPSRSRSPRG